MIRHLEEDLTNEVGSVLKLCDQYVQSLKNFYRQLSLQSNELLRGAAMTRLEVVFNNLKNEHYRLIRSHLTSEIFNILNESSPIKPVKIINFTAQPPNSILSKQSTAFFDKFDLPQSIEKSRIEEFETNSSLLVKLDHFEKVNIGHIYCVEDIRRKSRIISGKFGTAIVNDSDQIISKIKHHADKIYNCRFYKSYQLYFPNEGQAFIWKDDGVAMTLNHSFNSGLPQEMLNISRCVQSVGDLVYFLAIPSQIIELDWRIMENAIKNGAHYYTGRVVFEGRRLIDFYIFKKALFYVTSSNRVGRALIHQDHANIEQALIDPHHLSYTSIVVTSKKVIVAGHHESIAYNFLYLLSEDLVIENREAVPKQDQGYNPIRTMRIIERENSRYLLCMCAVDLIILFSVTETSLNRLEQLDVSRDEDRANLNGLHMDPTQSQIFIFGDFNFQQMLKLRV